ncbi:hypothetical protein Vdis_0132 [Vulcanisaeta distributa DSM 14429]|uniref:Uncharacterized protein n=1 Tax=Vulcanisaeta distributa (strain DSM 14429 / JCM 11212 / NBRC 100878 / IC-017) TaxID=572478 RepID=E1QSM8_VULDI|nr:hypothetical protein Vdis_0132 [Vulcanisaeta distributa DSM 14429]
MRLFKKFLDEELEKYRVNIRRNDGGKTYKITTARVRRFMSRYLPENIITSVMIALSQYLPAILYEEGYEIVHKSKGKMIIRKVIIDGG